MSMDLRNRRVVVIGLAKTGLATARFLVRRGARVLATDEKPRENLGDAVREIEALGVTAGIVPYGLGCLDGADMVIPSPGVPPTNPILAAALSRNIPILSELELASRFIDCPIIAITGTNGKTTTTTLVGEILAGSGKRVFVGGNIGAPLIGFVADEGEADYVVVEVSSFQLQWTEQFRPFIAALLNTTCDHVDYHGSFEAYLAAKEKVFAKQTERDYALLNADEPSTESLLQRLGSRAVLFSSSRVLEGAAIFSDDRNMEFRSGSGDREVYPLDIIRIPGRHNVENVMVALAIGRLCGCVPDEAIRVIENFKGLPHRIEYAGEVDGVRYYDDSKGTNVDAVRRAVETFSAPVVLLLGGRDKEGNFETLAGILREKVKHVLYFGEARDRIAAKLADVAPGQSWPTLAEAVRAAAGVAGPGDVVLLSPGCASFDEFKDYKHRGDVFQRCVKELGHV